MRGGPLKAAYRRGKDFVRGLLRKALGRKRGYVPSSTARNIWGLTKTEVDRLRRERCQDPAQWHRWHKVNAKRQRQLAAIRRGGFKLDGRYASLPRYLVE